MEEPRHIEFQLLGDQHGNLVHLFERECSLQRRYQKIIEEAPSPTLTPELRARMAEAALKLGEAINYYNAGTIEFLVDAEEEFYFLEMNTRVQVEHPVTEMTTGVDIVAEQLRVAAGQKLSFTQADLQQQGHAIECRVYAEDPKQNFLPSPGEITYYSAPNSVRLDTAITGPTVIESQYDPMISKMIVYRPNREDCIRQSIEALEHYVIHGIETNIAYLRALLRSEDFQQNTISTKYCDEQTSGIIDRMEKEKQTLDKFPVALAGLIYNFRTPTKASKDNIWTEIGFWRHIPTVTIEIDEETISLETYQNKSEYEVRYNDTLYRIHAISIDEGKVDFSIDDENYTFYASIQDDLSQQISWKTYKFHWQRNDLMAEGQFSSTGSESDASDDRVSSPMPGKVIQLNVAVGDEVKRGDTLLIVEAMKMENQIIAPRDAQVKEVRVEINSRVNKDEILIELE